MDLWGENRKKNDFIAMNIRSVKGWQIKLFNYSMTFIVILFVFKTLLTSLELIKWSEIVISPSKVIVGGILILVGTLISCWVYNQLYKNLGTKLSLIQTLILSTVPTIGKYIPGKIFTIAGHTTIAKLFGIRLVIAGSAALIFVILGLISASALGLLLISLSKYPFPGGKFVQFCALFFMLFVIVIVAFPNSYWILLNSLLVRFNRRPVNVKLTLFESLKIFSGLLLVNTCIIGGVGLAGIGVTEISTALLPEVIGIACLANVIGYMALFAPGGIGVREGVIYYFFTSIMEEPKAALLTLMMRLIHTFAEMTFAIIGTALLASYNKNKGCKPDNE